MPRHPKYYVCEYWDGGEWRCDEASLYTAAEDPNLRYSLKVSGTGTSTSAEYTTFDRSFRLTNPLADGSVYIRLRVVGNYAADGSLLDAANRTNSGAGFAKAQFVGANITSLGDKTPTKKLRVLCIGNSFSYYYYTASQLKQLAYREGLELDINAFFKGGQTLQQQLALAHSAYTVSLGGYDIAFVQDQSQNPATFAKNPSANAVINDSCLELVKRIKETSPQCRIILENTWSYPSGHLRRIHELREVRPAAGRGNEDHGRKMRVHGFRLSGKRSPRYVPNVPTLRCSTPTTSIQR